MGTQRKTALDADVAVVGGGPAGCCMAALLGAHGIRIVCIDQDDPQKTLAESFDGRTTAISFGSRRVIEAAGAWDSLIPHACAIEDIKITESGSDTLLEFLAQDVGEEAFGWIVENRLLRLSLYERLKTLKSVRHMAPAKVADYSVDNEYATVHLANGDALRVSLVIGADGRGSFTRNWMGIDTRGWDYRQQAIVCVVTHENPHNNTAIEDFRGEGPFAILPMVDDEQGRHRSSIVWTQHGDARNSAAVWDDKAFEVALSERFPDFYGTVKPLSKRFSYPLGLIHAHTYTGPRMALVGDAAHGIHPIAGQGLNLGLRDIAALSELLVNAKKNGSDFGSNDVLDAYQAARRFDNLSMAAATDTLNKLFSNNITPLRLLRRVGLRMVQQVTPARKFFMRQAMGSGGMLPSLIRDGKFRA